uniref:Toll-like receptor 8 n=1 Tax=Sillago sinica TaxID=907714 RepID=A0A5J6SEP2_9TELE|nr:toll-like receptor 8 [Sillago sinica]
MSPQFPCDVRVKNNNSVVLFDCKGRLLRQVPPGITSNATDLDLSENFMPNISVDSFSNLLNLTRLNLSWANKKRTVTIAPNAFKNLTKLNELKLTGNCLREIPGNLPVTVEALELNNNKIMLVDNRSLAGISNVTHLWLAKNCYMWNPCGQNVEIKNNSFAVMTQLQFLDLSFNNITDVPEGLPQSLQTLMLGMNRIEYIREDDFRRLQNLKVLKIQGNCPRCQNAPYPCVPCRNGSLGIHTNAFHSLTQLETLNLGGNSLSHLDPSWFENLSMLRQLFLSFNFLLKPITENASFLRHLPRLERLDLSFNFALKSYPETLNLSQDFSKLVSLRTLHLEGLVFQSIEPSTLKSLSGLKNLSALNLGTNFIIYSDSTIFSNFTRLKMIYLTENQLYPVSAKSPPHPSKGSNQWPDLSLSPPIRPYSKDFSYEISHSYIKQECFDSGRVLILSSNNLFFISPEQFKGYGDIACLNLSGNGFSAAPSGKDFVALPNLTYLDLSFNKIDLAYNEAFRELKKLKVLDLSHNAHYFRAFGITHNLNFTQNLPVLRVLNMSYNSISTLTTKKMYSRSLSELQFSYNYLGTLWKERDGSYEEIFTHLTNLTILDISHNKIDKIPNTVYELLPCTLVTLHISHNALTNFAWDNLRFFHRLQTLDLSFNSLVNVTTINPNVTHTLTFLDLSHNLILQLDSGFVNGVRSLKTLSLSFNKLTVINESTFEAAPENPIQTLFLHENPLQCTCDSFDFIVWIEKSNVKIPRLTTGVICATPENQKGKPLIHFHINECVNDSLSFLIYILTHTFIIVFILVTTVSHLFYWDASYVLHYVKAKLKGYSVLNSSDSAYDVFVTYDTKDPYVSEWVMKNLRVKLEEEGEKHLPLCLEERDWLPGVPLLDNLTMSIRYSRKTLFVLTEGYVKTGIFKLAMYLAHQRLLDENLDVIVLLMLEPVLQHSHFLRLRRRLCERSIMEWPRTAAAEPWFWQNLRNVVRVDNQAMYNKNYTKYFTIK